MYRVLHCIYDDPRNPWVAGGGAVRAFEIYRRLAPKLRSVEIVTGAYPGSRDETIEGVRYRRVGHSGPYAWSRASYTVAASRILRSEEYDVAIFDFSTYVPLRIPADRPIGFTVHHVTGVTALERWGGLVGRFVAWQEASRLRGATCLSATSRATERDLRALLGDGPTIRLVMAGVPDELFTLPRTDRGYLLYFGRLDWHHKGLDVLLDAMRILADRHPELRMKVAGRGKDAQRLLESVRALGLARHVEVVGPVGDAERNALLSGASALLMPSRFEGFGMVAAEAMAAGVPVIASDAGSLPEVVDPPAGGIVVASGDPVALARAAEELLGDRALRERLGDSARRSAERFRWDRIAGDHLSFVQAVHDLHDVR